MEKNSFYAVDIFAGCGGLSEGFYQAGFDIISQIEMDKWASESLRTRQLYYELKKMGRSDLYKKYLKEEITKKDIFTEYPYMNEAILNRIFQIKIESNNLQNVIKNINDSKKYHNIS